MNLEMHPLICKDLCISRFMGAMRATWFRGSLILTGHRAPGWGDPAYNHADISLEAGCPPPGARTLHPN